MKVFEVIEVEVFDCERYITTKIFSTKEKALACFKDTWEYAKEKLCGFGNKSDDDFMDLMNDDKGWAGYINDDNIDIYEDGYAAHNSYQLYIEEKEID